ncbi:hypothetical protein P153DRAFT_316318 [Dothidotthia symphoricarpi CBS 119687]|uniref:Zn(2)-C6 fungal-type domain-containing protein n=1 Tax=Dothidotthia symphoricarpi CBS 119687 TaxID=1392245 RepID=A0A6A6AEM9_9PLEO|nr:uncharacterized protein P153DRAFT_316318 [Dothidotthia symphoricarpi CBS 119687]KAF2129404.1 hypothetical protein P153DRAFT_316318 [Dothidotthia symphoricarpi CBS 119687]
MPKVPHNRTRASIGRAESLGQVQKKGSKSVACQRCHSRKVKCSGEHPCSNCRDAERPTECEYPSRDRNIKLSQQYVEDLLKENERLRNNNANVTSASDAPRLGSSHSNAENQDAVQNPLLEDRPWFLPMSSSDMPIRIDEAADAAFATRFRQTLITESISHLPRMSYVGDESLLRLAEPHYSFPTPARARFLVKAALNTVCRYYHIVRQSVVLEALEKVIANGGDGERLVVCKLLALFALGEAYSTKTAAQEATFPGLVYYAQARKMVTMAAERPQMDTLEIALLLVLYSYVLNRRHSAYLFASSAVRLAIIMGMQMNVPEHQYRNRLAREHRTRLWWTVYVLDRTCASKLGLPSSIADEDILVDLPSSVGLEDDAQVDFGDVDYILQSVELARLSAQSIRAIYSRRKHCSPFSQRVQVSLKDLTKWMEALPTQLHLEDSERCTTQSNHIVYLHLTFNQCVILATRPILLHVLRTHRQSWTDPSINPKAGLPDSALALAETCIQCSRHSYRLLTEAWVQGSFAIFDYFNMQYLFSSATILAISSLLRSPQSQSDGDNFNNAVELLRQLNQSGNYGAHEFCRHIDAIEQSIQSVLNNNSTQRISRLPSDLNQETVYSLARPTMTAGMALAEPSLQEFLADNDLNMQGFDNHTFDALQTPFWPEIWGNGWATG